MDFWKDLTDQDYKVYEYIKFYNIGRQHFYLPAAEHVAMKLGKSERSILRSYARLRELNLTGGN